MASVKESKRKCNGTLEVFRYVPQWGIALERELHHLKQHFMSEIQKHPARCECENRYVVCGLGNVIQGQQ